MKLKLLVILVLLLHRPTVQYSCDIATFREHIPSHTVPFNSNFNCVFKLGSIDSLIKSADIVVIDFWFTGCASCRKSIPELEEIYNEMSIKKVKFYGITAYDDEVKINNFKSKVAVQYPLLQVTSDVTQKYYVTEYPTLMIFNKGKPALTIEGYSSLFKGQVKKKLESLVK